MVRASQFSREETSPEPLSLDEQVKATEAEGHLTKLQLWERKLLDFSLRNNLLNLRVKGKVLPFVSTGINRLEDAFQSGSEFRMEADDAEGLPKCIDAAKPADESGVMDSTALGDEALKAVEKKLEKKTLCAYANGTALQNTLKVLHRAARTAMEENGANSLFLVLGMLRWFESEKSDKPRYAPILLLPVDIVRKAGMTYVLRMRDEDEILNTTLVEMMRQQYDVNLTKLSPLPLDGSGVDVLAVLDGVRKAIAHHKRWSVVEESVLGLFSFNKFVMWNDIHTGAEKMMQNSIIQTLVEGKLKVETPTEEIDARVIDANQTPGTFAVPLDVDSSQLEAVVESGEGRSFILYGPPGTGKSQTITNMIANALYHGRRVLFVAEKMAALAVVQKRLEKIGIGAFCLEMHSNKATKAHFLRQMEQALDVAHDKTPEDFVAQSEQLFEQRRQLIAYMEALHRKQPNGLSLHDCIAQWLSLSGDEMNVPDSVLSATKQQLDTWTELLQSCDGVLQLVGSLHAHPLRQLFIDDTSISIADTLRQQLSAPVEGDRTLSDLAEQLAATAPSLKMEALRNIAEAKTTCDEAAKAVGKLADSAVLREDPTDLRLRYNEVESKWVLSKMLAKKSLLGELKKYNPKLTWEELPQLIAALDAYKKAEQQLQKTNNNAIPSAQLNAACAFVHSLTRFGFTDFKAELSSLPQSLKLWSDNLGLAHDWSLWCAKIIELHKSDVGFADAFITQNDANGTAAANALRKAVCRKLAIRIIDADPQLQQFSGIVFEKAIERYRQLAKDFQNITKQALFAKLAARIPNMTIEAAASSEVGILKRNIKSKGRGTTIRQLVDQIPTLLPRLCPCMLMSPLSVAQYIDLDREKFDIVVFDEASQMPTSEAVGAIARGKALICVGDPKQMPPTNFFTTNITDEEDAAIDDMESILDDCITLSMPARYLTWHYRSKHESLIAFSNAQYYESKLYTFPSVDDRVSKVTLVPVDGVYDMGKTRCNRAEAEAIVKETLRRLADDELSKRSIGIVSFSKVQQDLIEDILEKELARHPELEGRAYDAEEPIFVKNLENVQGDERDVILFSIGYGPDKDGKVSMNFGPLNNAGGERRLNVAVSRARYEMMIFSTLQPEQIDLQRSNALGVEGLKRFLEFAKTGRNASSQNAVHDTRTDTSSMVASIAAEIEKMGYQVDTHVGRSNFKIDIAVVNPDDAGTYLLAILCDGKTYFETKTQRDREIVQPSVLGMLGWNIMKVWSVDWFLNRDAVLQRIKEKLGK